jgi:hypothetical protein
MIEIYLLMQITFVQPEFANNTGLATAEIIGVYASDEACETRRKIIYNYVQGIPAELRTGGSWKYRFCIGKPNDFATQMNMKVAP